MVNRTNRKSRAIWLPITDTRFAYENHGNNRDVIRQGYRTLTRMHFSKIAHAQSILVVCVWSVHKCFTKHNRV